MKTLSSDLRRLLILILAGNSVVVQKSSLAVVLIDRGNLRIGFPSEKFIPDFLCQAIGEVLTLICLAFKETRDLLGILSALFQGRHCEAFPKSDSASVGLRQRLL